MSIKFVGKLPEPRNWYSEKLSESELKEIHRFYWDNNLTQKQIADLLHCCPQTLQKRLTEQGLSFRNRLALVEANTRGLPTPRNFKRIPLSDDEIHTINQWYLSHAVGYHDVAKIVGCHSSTLAFRFKKLGLKFRPRDVAGKVAGDNRRGSKNHRWKGGVRKNEAGYVVIHSPTGERLKSGGPKTVFQHRATWEEAHGKLPPGWEVHHLNGVKDDNRLENLQAMETREHREYIPRLKLRIKELEDRLSCVKDTVDFGVVDY